MREVLRSHFGESGALSLVAHSTVPNMIRHTLFWIIEFALCFLFTLNLYMRGRQTMTVGSILGLLIFGVIIAGFFILGWGYGLLASVLSWIFITVSKPFAGKIAFRLLGYRTGIDSPAHKQSPLDDFMSGKVTVSGMFKRMEKQDAKDRQRLAAIALRPQIGAILEEMTLAPKNLGELNVQQVNSPSKDSELVELTYKLETLYRLLLRSSLADLAWEILATPEDLRRLVGFQRQGLAPTEIHSRFRHST